MAKIAFLFAGQGAQSVGMGQDLYQSFPEAQAIFDLAGEKIQKLCFYGPAEELNQTVNTQPCLFAMDLACARALQSQGVRAAGVAGFSLGEIPALAYAGTLSDAQALAFVQLRAQAMDRCAAAHPGAMYAVLRISALSVENICQGLEQAYPVNYNCTGQTVVACAEKTSSLLLKAVAEQGGRALRLAVSGAFHSPLMDQASAEAAEFLQYQQFQPSAMPVYANTTAHIYQNPCQQLARQINHPVLWQQSIEKMVADGFDTFIEVGPGLVLSGLLKKINPEMRVFAVSDAASVAQVVGELAGA
ncbi:MAG: ACP S-malonyltransferase [Clostridia bacterium]|nr:ACP S-malonyltransferase [Clostridia bacterium]